MLQLPDQEASCWLASALPTTYPSLYADLEVDVVVVGGGIAGLTAAYLLKQSGHTVAVVEKNTIGSGTTGGTTGKVTSQHGLIYQDLTRHIGEKAARLYAEAYEAAIERISQLITREGLECGWERDDNYVYTTDPGNVEQFKSEAAAAARLGLPVSFENQLPLPFAVTGAVKFANQAKFNAYKYVLGLARLVNGGGSFIFEHSNVTGFHDGRPATVRTKSATITAQDIIVATKVPAAPLVARGAYCLLEYPTTSYVVAGELTKELHGMYISPDKGHYSILPITLDDDKLLLIGGESHIPGPRNTEKRYQKLADYAEHHFGITEIVYRWKAMDYMAYDSVPLIGKVYPWSQHLYIATAFKKWGLSTSMVAGMILRDLILGKPNPWTEVFTPLRTKPILSIPRTSAKSFK